MSKESWWEVSEALERALAEKNKECLYQRALLVIRERQQRVQFLEACLSDLSLRECEDCNSWEPEDEFVQCGEDGPEVCKGCYAEIVIESKCSLCNGTGVEVRVGQKYVCYGCSGSPAAGEEIT